MKTVYDPRHKRREKIVKKLYEMSFYPDKLSSPTAPQVKNRFDLTKPIIDNLNRIDKLIGECAPEWPINKLNKVDLAILRLALFELMIEKRNPLKVIIDEAIELGKQFGSQNSARFINGALGSALKKINESRNNHH